ncbi:type VI secretion system protein ImpA [Pseudoduganella flava]|uniref:Type VI secretion system protein ImpA n=1 Tax=Pseudoduganella flava TaxID=871742 RepID=A0A562PH81_9BURK|nr:type VI secretion system protein TssA [Pseudoduganella flava]QGZ42667.1 type VI secretion system protein TssA [Pseudoduganella flava]TWI43832.1 type VI secretion system protein ImpA [Pseudoduganella flava]
MNTMTDPVDSERHMLDQLLAPIAPDAPCGAPAGFDAVFTRIRLLREEDDPALPMRQWERPLKEADWPAIEALCVDVLTTRSKHLQIAVWLVEAWLRQRGYPGLALGLRLLDGLLATYWSGLYPAIEDDGDCDQRLAPLEWLNEALGQQVAVHAPLLPLDDRKPPFLALAAWERMTAQEVAGEAAAPGGDDAPLTRAGTRELALRAPAALRSTRAAVAQSCAALHAIHEGLVRQLGAQAPNLARLQATLEAALRALAHLEPAGAALVLDAPALPAAAPIAVPGDPVALAPVLPADVVPGIATAGWRNRADAYATLDALAAYLMEIEPHSPVPFLIRRALHWGAMPLPELIAEIIREEGDLNRLIGVLGLKM